MSGVIQPSAENPEPLAGVVAASAFVEADGRMILPKELLAKIGASPNSPVKIILEDNRIVVVNAARYAMEKLQEAMKGEAERLGLKTDEDVFEMWSELRHSRIKKLEEETR